MRNLLQAGLLLVLVGCASETPIPNLHPVQGTITRNGEPVKNGALIFLSEDGPQRTISAIVEDGKFTVRTERRLRNLDLEFLNGAPIGTYRVVYHPPSNGAKDGLEVELSEKVTVEARSNELKLTLPSELPRGNGAPRED